MKVLSISNGFISAIAANEYNMGVLVPVPSATAAILRNPVPNLQSSYPQCCESPLEIAMKQALFNMAEGLKLASHRLDIMGPLGNGKCSPAGYCNIAIAGVLHRESDRDVPCHRQLWTQKGRTPIQ